MNANEQIADATVERALVLNRYSAGTGRQIVELLNDAQRDIIRKLPDVAGEVSRRRLLSQLKEIQDLIGSSYDNITKLALGELNEIAEIEALWQMNSVNAVVGVEIMRAMPTAAALEAIVTNGMVLGNPAATWWAQQSHQAQNEFSRVIRLGLSQSETNQQIARRVRDSMGIQQRHAFSLVKTSTQAVSMQAREEMLAANDDVVKGKISIATLDSRTTFVCADCDQATYNLENEPIAPKKRPYIAIPRHFGCRSMWSVLLKKWDEMGLPFDEFSPSTRASLDGQIPAETSFDQFLSKKPKEWQEKYLGKGRAELYRDGKITLSDMVDGLGRELTIAQLREL